MTPSPPIEEEELTGGGVNHVVRIGTTVRRPTGRWTPTVHALLSHLVTVGFTGASASHGLDDQCWHPPVAGVSAA
ncbi:hypothetical protein AB0B56_28815 [Streptosporangium canum]|uniref:hypothetical protein n=1 Tax=Streptosporangium canum TaxID=324952 RepID=UPI003440C2EB